MWFKWLPWKLVVRRLARSHGFVDPIAILSHMERFAQPSEVAAPIEMLRAGVVFHARGFINSRAIQQNLDWVWPYWINRQFSPGSEAFIPRAFSLTHINLTGRNWTAVGLPGCDALPIVDPCGLLTPFWDGWSLDAWVVAEDGRALIPSQMSDVRQQLDLSQGLAVVTASTLVGLELQSRAEVAADPGPVCRLTLRARSDSRAWLVVSARPCNPEGISFIHRISLEEDGRQWTINRRHTAVFGERPDRYAVSHYALGDVRSRLFIAANDTSVACDVGMATAAALFEIRGSREVAVQIPLEKRGKTGADVPAGPSAAQRWDAELAPACRLVTPDERMQFLYDAALRTLIVHCPDDVYAGPFTYKRFWFRDAAFILHAMLCVGLERRARHAIERFFPRQTAGGYFRSQEGEWDSNGEVLWLLQRFFELTGQEPPRGWAGPIGMAVGWIARKRLGDEIDVPHAGLMPAGFSAEHLGPNDYYYWDDFWSVAGLVAGSRMFTSLDRPEKAARYADEGAALTAAIERSLAYARSRLHSAAMPASPYRRLDSGAIGSIVAGYPLQLLGPRDERLLATADFLIDRCSFEGGFFQDMIHSGINAYLTLHIAQVLLRAGDPRFADLVRTVAELASPTGQWPEAIHPRTRGGCMGDGQHVWAAAEWVMIVRNGFVYEETHPSRLVIGAGLTPELLRAGGRLSFGPAPTAWGPVSVRIEPSAQATRVQWQGDWFIRQPRLEVRLPGVEPVAVCDDRRQIDVPR